MGIQGIVPIPTDSRQPAILIEQPHVLIEKPQNGAPNGSAMSRREALEQKNNTAVSGRQEKSVQRKVDYTRTLCLTEEEGHPWMG